MKTQAVKDFLKEHYPCDDSNLAENGTVYITLKSGDKAIVRVKSFSSSNGSFSLAFQNNLDWTKMDLSQNPYFILCGETQKEGAKLLMNALESCNMTDDDYIVSIELMDRPVRDDDGSQIVVRGIDFEEILKQARANPEIGIYRKHIEATRSNSCNAVLIRATENGKPTTRYLDAYFASSDTRVFRGYKITKTVPMFVPSNEAAVKEDDGEAWPHNLLIFGAPGTGKSHAIDEKVKDGINYRRVTFYEDYSYERFVGAYLPETVEKTSSIEGSVAGAALQQISLRSTTDKGIAYSFVPGVFLEMIADAWYDRANPYALVIEEINRANAAAVFGDFFQLLDRELDGESKYAITLPPDMRSWLDERIRGKIERDKEAGAFQDPEDGAGQLNAHLEYWLDHFKLPGNLYLWATMNSADQGVYPLDAAFKRRWSFRYMSTQGHRSDECRYLYIRWRLKNETRSCFVLWDDLKSAINQAMESTGIVEEDRLLGPWYFQKSEVMQIYRFTLAADTERLSGKLPDPLTNKLFQYLRQDVFRNDPGKIFDERCLTMSSLRDAMCSGKALNDVLKIELPDDKLRNVELDRGTTFEAAFAEAKMAFGEAEAGDAQDGAADAGNETDSVTDDVPGDTSNDTAGSAADAGDSAEKADG